MLIRQVTAILALPCTVAIFIPIWIARQNEVDDVYRRGRKERRESSSTTKYDNESKRTATGGTIAVRPRSTRDHGRGRP
jgi:hypothetical protein